jgi:hypothetical protein
VFHLLARQEADAPRARRRGVSITV